MKLVGDKKNKRADINVNDIAPTLTLDQEESEYEEELNDNNNLGYIKEGNNFIEIRPRTMLDIVEIIVEIR